MIKQANRCENLSCRRPVSPNLLYLRYQKYGFMICKKCLIEILREQLTQKINNSN